MTEPLTNEQIWGEPEEFEEDGSEADRALEEILENGEGDVEEADYFDGANWCPGCGQPYYLCTCRMKTGHEDLYGDDYE